MKGDKELTETEADSYDTNHFVLQMRRHYCSIITKLQCCNRHQHKMGATNENVQLLAEAMCITRSVISLPTLLHDSEYHDSSRQIQNMEGAFVPTASSL